MPSLLFSLPELETAERLVRSTLAPTPQYAWPLLAKPTGCSVWVKHENHTPTGAFKIRGGLVYLSDLKQRQPALAGVITATRGNHGQSIAMAATLLGVQSVIVVPEGNSKEKNAAMEALGGRLVISGRDFDEARSHAIHLAEEQDLHMVPPFHPNLVMGVATYGLELFRAVPGLDVVYVPIGMGSGICGLITVRDLLGLKTEIIGVVAAGAPAMAKSFSTGRIVRTSSARTFADGMACREPDAEAFEIIQRGASRIVQVEEAEIAEAARMMFTATHNVAEGAGAAPLAALLQERESMRGKRTGLILSGGNIDHEVFAEILAGRTPKV